MSSTGQSAALLFDLDGTLAESDSVHYEVFRDYLREFGVEVDTEYFAKHIHGKPNSLIFPAVLPHIGEAQYATIAAEKERRFRARVAEVGVKPVAGVDALFRSLREGTRVACVTNAPRVNAETLLAALGLSERFADNRLVIGEECAAPKPSPDPYLQAMHALGAKPHECIVFEDSTSGVRAGVAAGAQMVVGVRTHATDEVLRAAGAHLTVADFVEGLDLLLEMGALPKDGGRESD